MPLPSFLRKGTTQTHVNNNSQIFVFSSFLQPRVLVRQPPDGQQGRGDQGSYLCVAFSSFNLMVLGLSFFFFFSGRYIPSELISLISHWLGFQTHFFITALCLRIVVAVSSVICPLICLGFIIFLIIYFYLFIFSLFIPVAEREDNLFLRSWCLLVNRAHNPVSRSLASL